MSARIRIAVSSCLLGQKVRYDGDSRLNEFVAKSLGKVFEFVPFCPEVAIGMGVPRPPIRLVKVGRRIRARGVEDPTQDVTEKLLAYAEKVAPKLANVSGYIFKKNSPSCGPARVKLYTHKGKRAGTTHGVYAGRLQELHPAMPVTDEDQLMNPAARGRFLARVFVYHQWQQLNHRRLTAGRLLAFHDELQSLTALHGTRVGRTLQRMVSRAVQGNRRDLHHRYIQALMAVL